MSECMRCGQCCISVGRGFWLHGDFADYPELQRLAETKEDQDDGLPCEMLQMTNGVAKCKIQILYGWKAKPKVCREYPALECHHSDNFSLIPKGRSFCYQQVG